MFPLRHSAATLSATARSATNVTTTFTPLRPYTSRSNGSAFLNNLDFLAPAPTTRVNAASPSHPRQSSNREFIRSHLEIDNSASVKNTFASKRVPSSSSSSSSSSSLLSSRPSILGSSLLHELTNKPSRRPATNTSNNNNVVSNSSNKTPISSFKNSSFSSIDALAMNTTKDQQQQQQQQLQQRPPLDRPRRDEEIDSQWIQYVSPEGNQGQKNLSAVLRSFDRSQYFLIEVDANARPPICKLFSKRELYEKAKAAKQAKKKSSSASNSTTKELQLNWGTDPHDLDHKLARSRGFLEKGHRLEIQINGKKGKVSTQQERDLLLEKVKAEFEPISKYVKQPEWVKATTVTMLLQGTVNKKADKKQKE
ncbi:hypothetical protein BG004_001334 [Podila humilis]|nr:hypothetical protein BG004_001334 [Podila humilis]